MKCLTIVDDASHEAVAITTARALGGVQVTRVLEQLAATRGLPQVLRTDNGKEFNGRFRDECLNEHWFTSVPHAQVLIEAWRQEYNQERPKRGLGGLTPAAYAAQLTAQAETATVPIGL